MNVTKKKWKKINIVSAVCVMHLLTVLRKSYISYKIRMKMHD